MKPIRSDLPRLKRVFFCTLIFSLAAHAYMYFAFAPSHDSLSTLINTVGDGNHQLSLGRFLQPVYWLLRGRLPAPWLVGMLSILYLTAGSYFILAVLGIERRFSTVLLCGVFSTNLAVIATNATYLYSSDMYMLALACAGAGVWLWERLPPRWGTLAAIPCFTCCMGLYQAYIDVAIGLALLLLIRHIIEGEKFSILWKRAVRYGLSLLAGAVLYYAMVEFSLSLTGVAMAAGYNSLGNLLGSGLPALLRLIPLAYWDFFWFFMGARSYNPLHVRLCVIALGLLGVWQWVGMIRAQHIRRSELFALLLCVLLLPLGLNFVYVLSAGMVHNLMVYSFFLVYAALLLPFEASDSPRRSGFVCRTTISLICAYMVFFNIVFANGAYYKKQLIYEASSQHAFAIVERMEADPEYEPGVTPVALIGSFPQSRMAWETDMYFTMYRDVTGLQDESSFTYDSTFASYCRYALGHSINLIPEGDQLLEIQNRPSTLQMPLFPQDGSCQMIDGVMVVRLS